MMMSRRSRALQGLAPFYGGTLIVLLLAGCGGKSAPTTATRYDITAGKLCLSLISRLGYVTSHTTLVHIVLPRGVDNVPGDLDNRTRDQYVRGGGESATVIDSVLAELRSSPASAAQIAAKRTFESDLTQSAAAYRSFAVSVKQSHGAWKPRPYLRRYAAGYVDALKGCGPDVHLYERKELAR